MIVVKLMDMAGKSASLVLRGGIRLSRQNGCMTGCWTILCNAGVPARARAAGVGNAAAIARVIIKHGGEATGALRDGAGADGHVGRTA